MVKKKLKLEHETARPAWLKSAFWLPIIVMLMPVAESALKILPANSWAYFLGSAFVAGAYAYSRNGVYQSRNETGAAVEIAKLASASRSAEIGQDFISQMIGSYANEQAAKVAVNLSGMNVKTGSLNFVPDYTDLTPAGVPMESE